MIWRFPSEASPPAIGLRPCPARVLVRGGGHQSPVDLQPATLPLDAREALVRQVGLVKVFGYERFPDGALVGGGGGEAESGDHAVRVYHEGHLEPVDPLGLGGAPAEARLPAEEPLREALTRTLAGTR